MRPQVRIFAFLAILTVVAITATSQTVQPPRFDVASIKVNVTDVPWHENRENCQVNGMGHVDILTGGRVRAERALIPCILADAYNVWPFQVLGGPPWVDSVHFDIDAKPATASSEPHQIRAMLQSLLADRFQMKVHRETRQMPVYVLSVAKSGLKLQAPQKGSCLGPSDRGTGLPPPSPPGQLPAPLVLRCGDVGGAGGPTGSRIDGGQAPISSLVRFLTNILHRPIIDKTGLIGTFDIHVVHAGTNPLATDATADTGPTLYDALEEQAGLKLEPGRGPLEVLIIDHAEKPDAN